MRYHHTQLQSSKYLLLGDNSQMGPRVWTLAHLRPFKLHVSQIEPTIAMVSPTCPSADGLHLGKEHTGSSSWSRELHSPPGPCQVLSCPSACLMSMVRRAQLSHHLSRRE